MKQNNIKLSEEYQSEELMKLCILLDTDGRWNDSELEESNWSFIDSYFQHKQYPNWKVRFGVDIIGECASCEDKTGYCDCADVTWWYPFVAGRIIRD